jgi:eukaryotic-like serine/threonine-protein kinase
MSPEQARGEELDRRTDLFSMGVVLYEMATGQVPFAGNTSAVIFDAILNREPRSVVERNPVLPTELGHIISKALEKDRKLRYQSAADLRTDLERLKRDSSADRRASVVATPHRRPRARLALNGIVLLIVAIATAVFILRKRPEHPVRELVPTRVTSNSSDALIATLALSPDGKYLAYSDTNGLHLRSIGTTDTRVLPDTKGMFVQYWAADSTQFFASKIVGDQFTFYSVSLPGGLPHPIGDAMPSPTGQYSFAMSFSHVEVRRTMDGKVYSIDRKDADNSIVFAWSPRDKRLAVVFDKFAEPRAYSIEALDPETGRWTTLVPSQREYITGVAWLSEHELVYTKYESTPRTDSNLWVVDVNPSTGLPSGAAKRRTQWTDFRIQDLSASADGSRLCLLRGVFGNSIRSNVYVGDLQAHGTRLASLRRLTPEDAENLPRAWTPDSKAVLLQSDRDGQTRIYKQDIDKDSAELVTSGPGSHIRARVSPDGRSLLYFSNHEDSGHSKTSLMRMPLAGGIAQEILSGDDAYVVSCSRIAGGACVLTERRGKVSTFSLLDCLKGRGPKVLETTAQAGNAAVSPDGQHIAFVLPGAPRSRIRVVNLHGATESEITVSGAKDLGSLDWSADGTGFFSVDMQQTTARLLHVERSGASQVLWALPFRWNFWAVPSPDGRYLATWKMDENANVWMVENP